MSYPKGIQRFGNVRKVGTVRWLMRLGLLLAAMVLTAGCGTGSGEEPESLEPGHISPGTNPGTTPEVVTGDPIAFSAIQQEEQSVTRSTQPLVDKNVHIFMVWGYKNTSYSEPNYGGLQAVMPGYYVNWEANSANTTSSNTNDWEYVSQQPSGQPEQTIKYWDWSAKAYRFFGLTHSRKVDVKEYPTDNPEYCQVSFTADATDPETCRY